MKNGLPNIRLAKSSRTGLVKKGYLLLGLVFVVKGRSHLMNREMQVFFTHLASFGTKIMEYIA